LGGTDQAIPFYFQGDTGMSDMPAQWGISPGIGATFTGANPEQSTHIVTGPTVFGNLKMGPSILKAEHPKN